MTAKGMIDCYNCNCKPTCFSFLTEEEYAYLNQSKRTISFNKGETLIKQGTFASHIIYIRNGLVKECTIGERKDNVISIDADGSFLGLDSLFSSNTFPYSIIAYKDTAVCMFEMEVIRELIRKNGVFAEQILIKLNERNRKIYDRFSCLHHKDASSRVLELLNFLGQEIYQKNQFHCDLSKKDICEFTQISADSLNRILKDFHSNNIVSFEKKTVTLNTANKL